jgi:hypothetical protein
MGHTTHTPPEGRLRKVSVAVTETEKRAVRTVALLRGTDESNLVRSTPIADIVAEFERHRELSERGAA